MENILKQIRETASVLEDKGFKGAKAGIILGTGLGSLINEIDIEHSLSYNEIPHFPIATVEFHKGQLILGRLGNKKIIVLQGRFHYYEGYNMQEITFPVRVLKALGIEYLFLSNAAGGLNSSYRKGDLALIDDHINFLPENPLRGLNSPEYGNRFVDMIVPYNMDLNKLFISSALELNIPLKKGIYAAVMGPNLETRAEYRYLRSIGADMVGMSTVPEVIVANHISLACAAISVITDECDPDNLHPVNISEIIAVAGKADLILSKLFKAVLQKL